MCHDQIIVCRRREATRYLSTIADFPAANAESLLARALLIMRGRQGSLAFLTDYWSGTAHLSSGSGRHSLGGPSPWPAAVWGQTASSLMR